MSDKYFLIYLNLYKRKKISEKVLALTSDVSDSGTIEEQGSV